MGDKEGRVATRHDKQPHGSGAEVIAFIGRDDISTHMIIKIILKISKM